MKIDINELKDILSALISIDISVDTGRSAGYIDVKVVLYIGDEVICRASSDGYINK